jgi:hypothetical protein
MSLATRTLAERIAILARYESGGEHIAEITLDDILTSLGAESKEERRRAAGALSVAARDRALVNRIETALDDPDPHRRWGTAFGLARAGIDSDAIFDAALGAFAFDDGDVRWAALEIVVKLARGRPRRIERLGALARETTAAGRKMALYGIRDLEVGDERVYTLALFSESPGVRLAAISGIARLETTTSQAHDALRVTVERDVDPGVRRAAAVTLARIAGHEPEVRAALERIRASSTDADLVRAVEQGLPKAQRS